MQLFFCLFFIHTLVYAQTNNYVIKQYNSENGLPQNSVKAIKFDKSGFCWLATEAGIVRFDNNNFKSYGSDVVKGLKGERIVAMMADTAGNIYAQTLDFQNIKITGSTSLYAYLPKLAGTDSLNFMATGYITKSPTFDSLWQAIYNAATIPLVKTPGGMKNGDIYLFQGGNAYFIRKTNITKLKRNETEPVGRLILGDHYYLQVWPGNRSRCWNNGVEQAGPIHGAISSNKQFLSGDFKALWCERGAFIYAGGNLYELFYRNGAVDSKCVLSNLNLEMPLCIAYRPDLKTYFIGTGTQGLYTIKVSDFIYPEIPKESGPENYYTIAKTSQDDILVNNALVRRDNSSLYVPLYNSDGRASYTDSADRIYYENSYLLSRYNSRTGVIDRNIFQLDNRMISIIPFKEDGTLLLCTHSSLYKITAEGRLIYQKKFSPDMVATELVPLKNEACLLATAAGLKWYDLKNHTISRSILDSFSIRNVYPDKQNRLWIGTDGKGSFLYTNNKLYPLPPGPRRAFSSIHAFIEDNTGNFWLPTNNGLYKVQIQTLADFATGKTNSVFWSAFNKGNGLRTNEFNGGANPNFQWLHDGALVLPSIDGLVKFYPNRFTTDFPREKIFIDEISIDGQSIILDSINGPIRLKPTFQNLHIKIACPFFGNKEDLKLEYKIGTNKGEWIPVPSSGIVSINTLPAGDYTLMFRKAGSNEHTPGGSISVNITVTPFFYRTGWFFAGIVLLIGGLVYMSSRRRVAKLEKEKLKIEKIVETRTEKLSTAVQQLEDSEIALKKSNEVKEQIISTVLHDIRSPLFSMRITGKSLVKNWAHGSDENLNQVIGLNQLIGELSRFTDQFFSWAVSQQEHFNVKRTQFSLQQLFEDIEALFREILQINNNKCSIHTTTIQPYTDKDILILILRNLVDNANKNTENGTISIKAALIPEGLQIQVSDTGKGLNAFQIENFLNRDKAVKNGRMGSAIILEMLDKIDGALSVTSEQGKGSVFTITLKQEPIANG
ncbi:sensor histidine kinase [Niabella sp.]|uniref:sensor histidine kinase n=1 Tax=Niabella sp. TaxID=1962976 RepID=UPI00262872EF|nr:sensor histidine kinase [Niabella sp.]